MLRLLHKRGAQSTAEYVIVLGLVVGAVIAMQTYVKRGLQGRIKNAVDNTYTDSTGGEYMVNFTSEQYEPYYLQSDFANTSSSDESVTGAIGGAETRTSSDANTRTGSQTYNSTEGADNVDDE